MRPTKTDSETEQLLQQLDELHAADQSPQIEPPAMIDQAVRNMARRELQQPPALPPIAGKLRWIAGLATVSVALIAVGISLTQTPQTPLSTDMPTETQGVDFDRHLEDSAEYPQPTAPEPYSTAPQAAEPAAPASLAARKEMRAEKQAAESVAADSAAIANDAVAEVDQSQAEQSLADLGPEPTLVEARSAGSWLDLIQQLHDQGLHTEAREQLLAFRQDYPDFPLPDWALRLQQQEP